MYKRVGILTGGGDAPGLNAVIRSVVLTAYNCYGWEVIGIRQGYDGLLHAQPPVVPLTPERVQPLLARGGTILGAVNRGNPFIREVTNADGTVEYADVAPEAVARLAALNIDALIVAGGDGTMAIAHRLIELGARIVGVPKTIDNDLAQTDVSFGFDTAILTATEALDKLQTTAESHHRVMVMEVMGRNSGWIALITGVAGGADVILVPEIPYNIDHVCRHLTESRTQDRNHALVVVAEGAATIGGHQQYYIKGSSLMDARLGGIGYSLGNSIAEKTGFDVRVLRLGHLQRGGAPTPRDRWLATRFGAAAVHLVARQQWGQMVALHGTRIVAVPMAEAVKIKRVEPAGEMVQVARDVGISFGDK
ncbi:MAG: ATP-dependent 6-phosphofructokinase [Chloroflexi bacterium]|nr:ATP-dependent 6-phosphofructokinase [Chloroflexota bacterium]